MILSAPTDQASPDVVIRDFDWDQDAEDVVAPASPAVAVYENERPSR
jgi:hypothetical protein